MAKTQHWGLKPEALYWPGSGTNLGQAIFSLHDSMLAKKKKSFVSVKHIFRSSVQYKGYFLLETFQKTAETVRRLPVRLEVHSNFSQVLQTLLQRVLFRTEL